ncbi:unnamed protein product [Cylindrotheca closterium]|uniref:Uncharacterized protein n=1 Tax=Cylindrotheca closterium TaxID=2856 RepID=A0AAD2FHM6_9STRA|nr:unnamed protein product [Cylindrotheca closterium]
MANVGSAKPPHWSQEEIKALAIAYCKVSEDPVDGLKQTGATYHARIVEEWTKQSLPKVQEVIERRQASCKAYRKLVEV